MNVIFFIISYERIYQILSKIKSLKKNNRIALLGI